MAKIISLHDFERKRSLASLEDTIKTTVIEALDRVDFFSLDEPYIGEVEKTVRYVLGHDPFHSLAKARLAVVLAATNREDEAILCLTRIDTQSAEGEYWVACAYKLLSQQCIGLPSSTFMKKARGAYEQAISRQADIEEKMSIKYSNL